MQEERAVGQGEQEQPKFELLKRVRKTGMDQGCVRKEILYEIEDVVAESGSQVVRM